jgi:hypothetical protein
VVSGHSGGATLFFLRGTMCERLPSGNQKIKYHLVI